MTARGTDTLDINRHGGQTLDVDRDGGQTLDQQRKKEEFRTWFFLTLVMAPVLAVLIVSAFGFIVWFYQLIAGPPTV